MPYPEYTVQEGKVSKRKRRMRSLGSGFASTRDDTQAGMRVQTPRNRQHEETGPPPSVIQKERPRDPQHKGTSAPHGVIPSKGSQALRRGISLDGYTNPLAFLGESSPLLSSGTYIRNNLTSDPDLLTTLYRTSWLSKRIIDTPSEDMTRSWYRFSSPLPEEDLESLRRLESRHSVRQELTNAIRWARLYGGSLALMVIRGEEDRLA